MAVKYITARRNETNSTSICAAVRRRIAATLVAFAAVLLPLAARAEKANVFFIHGANVSEQDARAWASEMFKRLWQDDQTP